MNTNETDKIDVLKKRIDNFVADAAKIQAELVKARDEMRVNLELVNSEKCNSQEDEKLRTHIFELDDIIIDFDSLIDNHFDQKIAAIKY
ncbi:hypothetical protein EV681_4500 [Advenella incenata]|uniref:Uncharacterized protein n=1 Tax=Advenella incenata TaxID=267800 RepID=A0A4Q7V6H6_9BURK|nr:hypothetical protein [Advenella incenata]RZT91147.1 hypothetical protein EV681_4500 [Advenella incenata]